MANPRKIQLLDSIQGSSYLAILSALEVIEHYHLNLLQFEFKLVAKDNSITVVLIDKADAKATREGIGINLESRKELSPPELSRLQSDTDSTQIIDQIQGSSFLAIQAATRVFQRYDPDLMDYKIEVVREGNSVVIIFTDKDRLAHTRGSVGKPGFEVELNAQDLQVLRSNFIR